MELESDSKARGHLQTSFSYQILSTECFEVAPECPATRYWWALVMAGDGDSLFQHSHHENGPSRQAVYLGLQFDPERLDSH